MKYDIRLTATAHMSALVTVEADSIAEAEALAVRHAKEGNALWNYDGLTSDDSIEVEA